MNIKDQEIKNWLETRSWLFYYATTRLNSGIFYPIEKEYVKGSSKDDAYGYPYFNSDPDVQSIYLEYARSNCYTWAFPAVVLKIWGDEKEKQNGKYWLEVFFCYQRGETHYEKVLCVYVADLGEMLTALRLAGIHENYLTGDQKLPK